MQLIIVIFESIELLIYTKKHQMKKIIFMLSFVFKMTAMNAQIIQSRLLTVDQENMEKFMEGVAEKTKIYNSKKGQANYLTFRILTGKNAQNFIRMQVADSIQELDNKLPMESYASSHMLLYPLPRAVLPK
mgnify:CR=1 FL=1